MEGLRYGSRGHDREGPATLPLIEEAGGSGSGSGIGVKALVPILKWSHAQVEPAGLAHQFGSENGVTTGKYLLA